MFNQNRKIRCTSKPALGALLALGIGVGIAESIVGPIFSAREFKSELKELAGLPSVERILDQNESPLNVERKLLGEKMFKRMNRDAIQEAFNATNNLPQHTSVYFPPRGLYKFPYNPEAYTPE